MKKRWRILIGLGLAAALGALLWQTLRPVEPVYEGRTLSSWLENHTASSSAIPPYGSAGWLKAEQALRQVGTNGIPILLRMVRAKDPPTVVLKLIRFGERYRWLRTNYRYASSRQQEAEHAFAVLGPALVDAVPALIRIYEENVSLSSQSTAALALGHIGRGARAALPTLLRDFTHTNVSVRFYAVSAVMSIGGEPAIVLPALTSVLQDPSVDVRWNALVGLSNLGSAGRPAVPTILKLLNDRGMVGTSSITQQVATTLWRIAPEMIGHPCVVAEATTMITNGATAECVKVFFKGERKTLIPPGKHVPAVAQYWGSDPRPSLTLYRGPVSAEGPDLFLGQFEILELPAPEHCNVSTLCVIADGRIVLCARDNHEDRFLPIRRVEGAETQ